MNSSSQFDQNPKWYISSSPVVVLYRAIIWYDGKRGRWSEPVK
jgi:hypothetical protein